MVTFHGGAKSITRIVAALTNYWSANTAPLRLLKFVRETCAIRGTRHVSNPAAISNIIDIMLTGGPPKRGYLPTGQPSWL